MKTLARIVKSAGAPSENDLWIKDKLDGGVSLNVFDDGQWKPLSGSGDEGGSGAASDAVRYGEQSLTAEQKTQARTNIGAGTYSKPSGGIPASDIASGVIPSTGSFQAYGTATIDTTFGVEITDYGIANPKEGDISLAPDADASFGYGANAFLITVTDKNIPSTASKLNIYGGGYGHYGQKLYYQIRRNSWGTGGIEVSTYDGNGAEVGSTSFPIFDHVYLPMEPYMEFEAGPVYTEIDTGNESIKDYISYKTVWKHRAFIYMGDEWKEHTELLKGRAPEPVTLLAIPDTNYDSLTITNYLSYDDIERLKSGETNVAKYAGTYYLVSVSYVDGDYPRFTAAFYGPQGWEFTLDEFSYVSSDTYVNQGGHIKLSSLPTASMTSEELEAIGLNSGEMAYWATGKGQSYNTVQITDLFNPQVYGIIALTSTYLEFWTATDIHKITSTGGTLACTVTAR